MLRIAENMDGLRFDELAALYGTDLEVEWMEDCMQDLDEEWFREMKAEFRTYLQVRFFSAPDILPGIRPFYAMWELDGRYVSAVRVNVYEQGLLLEALQTGEPFRGQGYAALLIQAVMAHLAEKGSFRVYAQVLDLRRDVQRLLEDAGFSKCLDHAVKKDPQEWPPYYYKVQGYHTYLAQI